MLSAIFFLVRRTVAAVGRTIEKRLSVTMLGDVIDEWSRDRRRAVATQLTSQPSTILTRPVLNDACTTGSLPGGRGSLIPSIGRALCHASWAMVIVVLLAKQSVYSAL